jgi:hypothetical protein
MKLFNILLISWLALLFVSTPVIGGDFDWIKDYNIHAQADPSGLRAGRPAKHVVKKYNANKDNGWGALAKSLGIKPG